MESVASSDRRGARGGARAATWRLNEWEVYGILDAIGIAHGPAGYLAAGARRAERRRALAAGSRARGRGRPARRQGLRAGDPAQDRGRAACCVVGGPGPADLEAAVRAGRTRPCAAQRLAEPARRDRWPAGSCRTRRTVPGRRSCSACARTRPSARWWWSAIGGTLTEWYGPRGTTVFPGGRPHRGGGGRAARRAIRCCRSSAVRRDSIRKRRCGRGRLAAAVVALAELGVAFGPAAGADFTLEELEVNPAVASDGRLVALDGVGLASSRTLAAGATGRSRRSARCWRRGMPS